MNINKQTVVKGAMILMVANLTTRLIGMFFRIPLANILGEYGIGLFGSAFTIFTIMFIIATAGFPIAISKMVAESNARFAHKGTAESSYHARRIFQTAAVLLGMIGMIGSTITFFFAAPIANWLGNPAIQLGIMAIAPAVFFIALVAAHRGFFQGNQNMIPTAASELTDALSRLIIGILLSSFVMNRMSADSVSSLIGRFAGMASEQSRLELASAGALLGVTMGTVIVLIMLMSVYRFSKREKFRPIAPVRSRRSITKELAFIAFPITIGAAVMSLTSLIDLVTVQNRLQVNPAVFEPYYYRLFADGTVFAEQLIESGITDPTTIIQRMATALYGMYTGFAFPLFNIPFTFIVAISAAIVPAIAGAVAGGLSEKARQIVRSAIRAALLISLPAMVGLAVLAEPILHLLFNNTNAAHLLRLLALATVFVSLVHVTNATLQAYGKVKIPVYTMLIGGLAKLAINFFLIPVWGIDAAPISTVVCYAIIAVLNLIFLSKHVKLSFSVVKTFISPALSAIIMGVSALFVHGFLTQFIPQRLATVAAIGFAGIVYAVLVIVTRAVEREDIEMLPFGKKIASKIYRKG
ncbi:MAG: polysaccharide biosynthesis protein [Oscillospiraceae bacterium]|nr:polysaccharide biosynthesis protein [Oscillospiraceae bacterium]